MSKCIICKKEDFLNSKSICFRCWKKIGSVDIDDIDDDIIERGRSIIAAEREDDIMDEFDKILMDDS